MTSDFLVVGGGVMGLTTALAIRQKFADQSVTVIEKDHCGAHASGRNSGVLHAGFYYGEDSLKARFSVEGCARMTRWCEDRDLPIRKCGKLVVARTTAQHGGLDTLLERAALNGVALESITASEAREIEPRVKTCERALFSPSTASVDPTAVMASLLAEARERGIDVVEGEAYLGRSGEGIRTDAGHRECGYLVNAAGVYADRVAADHGFGASYGILPFKGLYLYGNSGAGPLNCHVYPVPDLGMPFLGVHFTVTTGGDVKIGPTATPAFWREHYVGLGGFSAAEFVDVVGREGRMALFDGGFRRHAVAELRKMSRRALVADASGLLEGVRVEDYRRWGRPGIRAQLVDRQTSELVMDFVVESDASSLHLLNAISPGFTCSLPFADWLVEQIH